MEQIARLFRSVDACAARLDELNKHFPNLATDSSIAGVEYWYRRMTQAPIHCHPKSDPESKYASGELWELAIKLLQTHDLEEVPAILLNDSQTTLSLSQLIQLVGNQAYLAALRKDAHRLVQKAVSYEQIAALWNDLGRPTLGGPSWNARNVSVLVE